jgi:hypothetical protein
MERRVGRIVAGVLVCVCGLTGCGPYTNMSNGKLSSIDRTPAFAEETVEDNLYLASYREGERGASAP